MFIFSFELNSLLLYFAPVRMRSLFTTVILAMLLFTTASGQERKPERYVQVGGYVLDIARQPIGNVNIHTKMLRTGTSSNNDGLYSIVALPGDTIEFSAVGFRTLISVVPTDIKEARFVKDVIMEYDTIALGEVTVLPWGSYPQFLKAMSELEIRPPEEIENMERNVDIIHRQIINANVLSPEAAYRHIAVRQSNEAYTRGQMPQNNLLNPFAWARFIEGLRSGLLRNERDDR